jgi:hypothetical protein
MWPAPPTAIKKQSLFHSPSSLVSWLLAERWSPHMPRLICVRCVGRGFAECVADGAAGTEEVYRRAVQPAMEDALVAAQNGALCTRCSEGRGVETDTQHFTHPFVLMQVWCCVWGRRSPANPSLCSVLTNGRD